MKFYYLKAMFYQNRFLFKSVNSITVSSGSIVASTELYSRDKQRRQTEVTASAQHRVGAEVQATTAATDKINVCVEK